MPRVKKVVDPVLIEPVVDIEDTEEMPLEPPKLKRIRTKKAKTSEPAVEPIVEPTVEMPSGKKENLWVAHVQKVRAANDGMSYKDAMKLAKETYNK